MGFRDYLEESLNSPVEFVLTTDTKPLKEFYGVFDIDDAQYGVSIVLTKYDRVYMLSLYRIVNVKKRAWSFRKPSHIRIALSTALKFAETVYPFIKSRFSGMIIELPKKKESEVMSRFFARVVKKSYIKQFKVVPVTKTTTKARNFMFLVKTGIDPKSIFKTATFKKNFEFEGQFDDTTMGGMNEPYKKLKQTVSTKPNVKLMLGGDVPVDLSMTEDVIAAIDSVEKSTRKPDYKKEFNIEQVIFIDTHEIDETKIFQETNTGVKLEIPIPLLFNYVFWNIKAASSGNTFKERMDAIENKDVNEIMKILQRSLLRFFSNNPGFLSQLHAFGYGDMLEKMIRSDVKREKIFKNHRSDIDAALYSVDRNVGNKLHTYFRMWHKTKTTKFDKIVESRLDVSFESDLPEFAYDNAKNQFMGTIGFEFENENPSLVRAKRDVIMAMPEVKQWEKDWFKNRKHEMFKVGKTVREYTRTLYKDINTRLREAAKSGDYSDVKNYDDLWNLLKAFAKAPKLENGIWVYRNANIDHVDKYKIGDDIIDPACLSTSIKAALQFGYENGEKNPKNPRGYSNTRLKIFIPKGTRCLPVLANSNYKKEHEVILPPYSILRIAELYENWQFEGHRLLNTVMLGSGVDAIVDAIESGKLLSEEHLMEGNDMNRNEYAPEDKWSEPIADKDTSDILKKMLKDLKKNKKVS